VIVCCIDIAGLGTDQLALEVIDTELADARLRCFDRNSVFI
jgi:hypothetical protein